MRQKEIAGEPILGVDTTDGWRFLLNDGWLLFRISGTEPLLRIYTELRDKEKITKILNGARELVGL
jgi:phosphomannomutase